MSTHAPPNIQHGHDISSNPSLFFTRRCPASLTQTG